MSLKVPMVTLLTFLITVSTVSVLSPVAADTYYGPSLSVSPSSLVSGGTVTAELTTGSGSTFTAPAGPNPCNSADPSTCFFPLQACNGGLNYYQINEVTVTDPNNNEYMLGSAITSGLGDPYIAVPRYTSANFAPSINVSQTDSGSIPFGTGVGGFFALTSNLPNPPNNINPEGQYYWWTVAGNVYGADQRLDIRTDIQPTAIPGTYTYDLEGQVFCGTHDLFFDASLQFTVSPAQIALNIVKTGASNPMGCSSATGAIGSVTNTGTIGYSVTVSNSGNTAATGVVVSDPVPSGESFGAASATSGTITQSGGVGAWSWTGTIASGGSVTISWTATVSTSSTSVTNVATITSPSASSTVTISGNPASCQTLVPQLTTSLSSSSITVGGTTSDTATLTGVTTSPAATGTITFDVYSGSDASACTSANLVTSASATLPSTTATFGSSLSAGNYEVQAVYSGDSNNAGATSACGSEPLTVGPPPQVTLNIVKTGASSPDSCSNATGAIGSVMNGGTIAYSVTVSNTGTTNAASVVVSDPVPAGETFGAASATSGTITQSGAAGSWSWSGAIAAGESVTITWTATVSTSSTSVVNVASITSPAASTTVTINGSPASCKTLVPQLTTSLSSTSFTVGGSTTDTATLTGVTTSPAATGTITFNVYSGSTASACVASNLVTSASSTLPSSSATFGGSLAAGSYEVQAVYSGDSNNAGAISTCGSEPLTVSPNACNIGSTVASNFNGNGIIMGNYIWFNAHIQLNSPSPTNGLTIRFTGQKITLSYNNPGPVTQTIAVPNGEIIFSSSATYATTVYGSGGWVTTEPVTQHADDQIFISGLMYKVPSPGLPGGIGSVSWAGTYSTNAPALNLQWQWGAAVYHYTGTFTADSSTTTGYNSLSIKPDHQGPFETVYQTTPRSNGDQSGTPENPAWQAAVVGGARGGGGSNFTGSWSSTGQADCSTPLH